MRLCKLLNLGVTKAFSLQLSTGRGSSRELICLGLIAEKKSQGNFALLNLAKGLMIIGSLSPKVWGTLERVSSS